MNTFKKYPKDWLIVFGVALLGIIAVMGWHWTDVAKTPFWQTFWVVAAIIAIIAWIVGWLILSAKDKGRS